MQNVKSKFVFFDVGGVVINDFSANNGWTDLKRSMGIGSTLEDDFDSWWKKNCKTCCTVTDVDDLISNLETSLGLKFDTNFSLVQAFVDRFKKNEFIWPVIEMISKQMPVGLLTNMYPRMFDKITDAGLYPDIDWTVVIDSSVVALEKPNTEIYELAQDKAKTSSENILFVDNTEVHLQAASKLGWQTVHYDPSQHEKSCKKLSDAFNSFASK